MLATGLRTDRGSGQIRTGVSVLAGTSGLVLVAVGTFLPWVTVFAGLQAIPGYRLDGGYLSGIAVAAAGLTLLAAQLGAGRILRAFALVGALVVALDAAYVTSRIAAFVADPGPSGPLSQPAAGPGAPVMALGGALLVIGAVAAPVSRIRLGTKTWTRLVVAAALFTAGWIHLVLTPEHVAESVLLGAGFGIAGLAQLGLAGLTMVRPRTEIYIGIVFVNVALLFLYGYAVVIGLPFGTQGHGVGEAVDFVGVLSKLAELIALGLAVWLVGDRALRTSTFVPQDRDGNGGSDSQLR